MNLSTKLEGINPSFLCPKPNQIFRSLELVSPEQVKVVILGLDPYINGEACGLSFSCTTGKIPPSLRIIFNELKVSGLGAPSSGDLSLWAHQGVLLLNTILTTVLGTTLAHSNFGWQEITGAILQYLASKEEQPIVFLIWGQEAKASRDKYINPFLKGPKLVLSTCHPAAEVYGRVKFTGCNHFAQANDFLLEHKSPIIQWNSVPTITSISAIMDQ